jgi:hypothetical protein
MAEPSPILIIFYNSDELPILDVDSEIFTSDRKPFHFFLFHNREMHFSKAIIYKQTLIDHFHNIEPRFEMDGSTLKMFKELHNFEKNSFDQLIEERYQAYLERINYRIDCIFQTFTLFGPLYSDKPQVYVFPDQIQSNFSSIAEKNRLEYQELAIIDPVLKDLEVFYWLNYYSRKDSNNPSECSIKQENISIVYKCSVESME